MRPNNQRRHGRGGQDRNRPKEQTGTVLPQNPQPQGQSSVQSLITQAVNAPDCSLCGKKIQDLSTAVVHGPKKEPVHFECVVSLLEKDEQCSPMEKVIYIGGGQFAVVNGLAYRNNKVEIIRKIKAETIEDRHHSVLGEIAVKVD